MRTIFSVFIFFFCPLYFHFPWVAQRSEVFLRSCLHRRFTSGVRYTTGPLELALNHLTHPGDFVVYAPRYRKSGPTPTVYHVSFHCFLCVDGCDESEGEKKKKPLIFLFDVFIRLSREGILVGDSAFSFT